MRDCKKAGNQEDIAIGQELLRKGKAGCIVLAGGDGSRLGWAGPKGTFPLSLVKQKTLFQMVYERKKAASHFFGRDLPFAVMTSPLNHEITSSAFPKDTQLFSQNMIPLLDIDHQPLAIARPNGNGEVLKCFHTSGLLKEWKEAGVEYIQTILIDNPLAEPYDANQIGIQHQTGAEITLKAIKRLGENEKVGVIGKKEGKVCIVEYSENPPKTWNLANTSLFSFSMPFIDKVKDFELPMHRVKKFVDGKAVYKRESFIFDLLPFSEKIEVILYPREETFAPLKNRDDVGKVQRALLDRDRRVLQKITGKTTDEIIELHAEFLYPYKELLQKWSSSSKNSLRGYLSTN